jgi:tRNA nucleotidyltransferase (CCA-adding enzyme)
MGKQSHDIDFALDDMDGEAFTLLLKKYCENNKVDGKISGMGVTKFNPEQSKNLKTATVKINDNMIDIVNLRSEKYTEDSRIPVIVRENLFRKLELQNKML